MDSEAKQLVQASWAQVVPIADTLAALFYHRLFQIAPETRRLFAAADITEQGRKLMQMITVAVRGLDRLDELVPAVQALGRRHASYGVQDSHYPVVGAALLWTLQKGLGDAFTPETRAAWADAYELLASVMRQAAHAVPSAPELSLAQPAM